MAVGVAQRFAYSAPNADFESAGKIGLTSADISKQNFVNSLHPFARRILWTKSTPTLRRNMRHSNGLAID